MPISGQVSTRAVRALNVPDEPMPALEELRQQLDELGVALQPTHPGSDEPTLAPLFTVEVPNDQDVRFINRVLDVLRGNELVEAAYYKPPDELPSP